jgi:hypothetical protein
VVLSERLAPMIRLLFVEGIAIHRSNMHAL